MESMLLNPKERIAIDSKTVSNSKFLEANTVELELSEIKDKHIIPVFLKDNEPTISQVDFVEVVSEAARTHFNLPFTPDPSIRVSHPIKGRIYEARYKKAVDLLDSEKTIYYERMAFMLPVPSISTEVGGNSIELTIGGVKAYNLDNLNGVKGSKEHFKVFVGFKNTVCTNLCISTDGVKLDMSVRSLDDLYKGVLNLLSNYDDTSHIESMSTFNEYQLTENQFAQILGKARMYQFLPKEEKELIPELMINDTQISRVAEYYFSDSNFKRNELGSLDLWRFYNLMTGAVKSSYIDRFLERGVNCFEFTQKVQTALESGNEGFWYLS